MGGSYPRPRDWPLSPEQEPPPGAKAIKLTRGWCAWVDIGDYEMLAAHNWYAHTSSNGATYARRSTYPHGRGAARAEQMHSVLMLTPPGMEVDHKEYRLDEKVVDNRRCNLRLCTHQENSRNQRRPRLGRPPLSIYRGVTRDKRSGKWHAQLWVPPHKLHLGNFDQEHYAALAHDYAARKHFGEFARTNFPSIEGPADTLSP